MNFEPDNHTKLNTFFKEEYQGLKKYVKSRISESADRDAEDIIQDVALNLFSRQNNNPIQNVAGFVYGSIRNKIVDVMRSRKINTNINEEREEKIVDLMEWLYQKADNSHSERMKHELKNAIAGLKPEYQHVILAIDFERLSYKELAAESGIAAGTLMSRRHRALGILNQKLGKKKIENY